MSNGSPIKLYSFNYVHQYSFIHDLSDIGQSIPKITRRPANNKTYYNELLRLTNKKACYKELFTHDLSNKGQTTTLQNTDNL